MTKLGCLTAIQSFAWVDNPLGFLFPAFLQLLRTNSSFSISFLEYTVKMGKWIPVLNVWNNGFEFKCFQTASRLKRGQL